tara:strand:- start:132 stop:671 length:540 start_codon:yes stop_codon:yes gene_type:complete
MYNDSMPDSSKPENESDPTGSTRSSQSGFPTFWSELRRRKVMRVAITYAIVAWMMMEIAAATFGGFGIPELGFRFVVIMLMLGFPVVVLLAWAPRSVREGGEVPQTIDAEEKEVFPKFMRSWLSLGFSSTFLGRFGISERVFRFVVLTLILGFPVAVIVSWGFDLMLDRKQAVEKDKSE